MWCSPQCATVLVNKEEVALGRTGSIDMTTKTATARARINPEVKDRAERILHSLGLSVSGAFELFYRQIILNNGLPFEVQIPNEVTRKAIKEARSRKGKKHSTTDELFGDLGI